jgi:hypothetical protein
MEEKLRNKIKSLRLDFITAIGNEILKTTSKKIVFSGKSLCIFGENEIDLIAFDNIDNVIWLNNINNGCILLDSITNIYHLQAILKAILNHEK